MKNKSIVWLLVVLIMTGCTQQQVEKEEAIEEVVEEVSEVESSNVAIGEVGEVKYEITLQTDEGSIYSEVDPEIKLIQYCYTVPIMTASEDTEESKKMVEAFNAPFLDIRETQDLEQLIDWAEEDLQLRQESEREGYEPIAYEYVDEVVYTVYERGDVISLSGSIYSYLGGAHPNSAIVAYLFDKRSSSYISLLDLARDADELGNIVADAITAQAEEMAKEYEMSLSEMYWEGYEESIAAWGERSVILDDEGITIVFSAYDLASYAAGPQVFHLSYNEIVPYLQDSAIKALALED